MRYYGVRVLIDHPAEPGQISDWVMRRLNRTLDGDFDDEGLALVRVTYVPTPNDHTKKYYDIVYTTEVPLDASRQEDFTDLFALLDRSCNYPIGQNCVLISEFEVLRDNQIPEVQRAKEKRGTAEIAVAKDMPVGMFSKEVSKFLGGKKKTRRNWKMPRKMSRTYCKKTPCKKMGFTQRSSCRPYKNCFKP